MTRNQGKLILITGASAGIGAACARRFAAEGSHLILWARRRDRLEKLASSLERDHGVSVRIDQVDVRDKNDVRAAAARLTDSGSVPDVLVNNAGLARGMATLQEGDPDHWDEMIDTNVKGLLYVTRALLPHMVERGRGHVVNLGSVAGYQVYPKGAVYNATKFAVRALNEGMNLDLLGTPIRVTSISPGMVETEFSVMRFDGDEQRARQIYQGMRPLNGDDIAELVVYAVGLPEHMYILDLIVMPTPQRSVTNVHRQQT